jgi:hypothetical protein
MVDSFHYDKVAGEGSWLSVSIQYQGLRMLYVRFFSILPKISSKFLAVRRCPNVENYNFTCCFTWKGNVVSYSQLAANTEYVRSAENNISAYEI